MSTLVTLAMLAKIHKFEIPNSEVFAPVKCLQDYIIIVIKCWNSCVGSQIIRKYVLPSSTMLLQ